MSLRVFEFFCSMGNIVSVISDYIYSAGHKTPSG